MDQRDRAEILAEILDERLGSVQHIIDEWSVPEADALSYAQAKDLIWELLAPLGLTMLGFSAADQAAQEAGDLEMESRRAQFASVGENVGRLLDHFLAVAADIRL